jgi:8-oxo-dGTP diphosphatase
MMPPMNGNAISVWIAELGIWPLVVVLVPNLMFRKYGQAAGKKRMASLLQAIAVFVITTAAAFVVERELTDIYLFGTVAVVAVVLFLYRGKVFPYRLTCAECDAKLDFRTIYFMDDNLCVDCRRKKDAMDEELESSDDSENTSEEEKSDE